MDTVEAPRLKRHELVKACQERFPYIKGNLWLTCANVPDMLNALETGIVPDKVASYHEALQNAAKDGSAPQPKAPQPVIDQDDAALALAEQILITMRANGGSATVDPEQVREIAIAVCNERITEALIPKRLEIVSQGRDPVIMDLVHKQFEDIMVHVGVRDYLYLLGSAGVGKSELCKSIAKAFGLAFRYIPTGPTTSKSDIFGFIDAGGTYHRTAFRECYEFGGVFSFEEIDNGHGGIVAMINSATSNGHCEFPDGQIAKHADFVCVANANTWGTGATREFSGRNELDSATLDRFSQVEITIDDDLELQLAVAEWPENPDAAKRWCKRVQAIRKAVAELKERLPVTPRATIAGVKLLRAGMSQQKVEACRIWRSATPEAIAKIAARC